ncbi:RIP metalloprotease RseP [candidate division WOR-3 bacterium]|nr:RIP metalloprotease RseP [candidate division WOR-3 bacterium]
MFLGIIAALIALSVMVFVHEFFHLIVAKLSKMGAPIFSIGLGPKLFSFYKWGETEFRVSAIPFGGYVEIKGMDPEQIKGEEDEFYSRNVLQKTGVVFAGPFSNFALGFLIFLFILLFNGFEVPSTTTISDANKASNLLPNDEIFEIDGKEVTNWFEITSRIQQDSKILVNRDGKETEIVVDTLITDSLIPFISPVVGNVIKGLPADKASIKKGDRITKIQDKSINSWEDITNLIHPAAEETLNVVYLSGTDTIKTKIVPEKQKTIEGDSITYIGLIGIEAPTKKMRISTLEAFPLAWQQSYRTASLIFNSFTWLFQRKVSPKELAGPVGIIMITKKSMDRGFIALLMFVGLITINLAIVNLIPIPPLDGFHIIMSLATFNSRKPPSKTLLKIVQTVGTIVLFSLMALLIFNDVIKGIQGKF